MKKILKLYKFKTKVVLTKVVLTNMESKITYIEGEYSYNHLTKIINLAELNNNIYFHLNIIPKEFIKTKDFYIFYGDRDGRCRVVITTKNGKVIFERKKWQVYPSLDSDDAVLLVYRPYVEILNLYTLETTRLKFKTEDMLQLEFPQPKPYFYNDLKRIFLMQEYTIEVWSFDKNNVKKIKTVEGGSGTEKEFMFLRYCDYIISRYRGWRVFTLLDRNNFLPICNHKLQDDGHVTIKERGIIEIMNFEMGFKCFTKTFHRFPIDKLKLMIMYILELSYKQEILNDPTLYITIFQNLKN